MATAKIQPINVDEQLGEFAVSNYAEAVYGKVYYAIRELQGNRLRGDRQAAKQTFSWKDYTESFELAFGKVKERRFSLEQLLQYAQEKLGKNLTELVEINRRSWERRRRWAAKAAAEAEDDSTEAMVQDQF